MNTTTLDTTSTKNNTQANQNDFLEVVTREYGRVSDLFDTTDQTTISINSFGRQVLREGFATKKFADNQAALIHKLKDGNFQVFSYIGDIHTAMRDENPLPTNLYFEIVSTPSAIPGERLSALSELLAPDKSRKVLATINYLKQYFDIPTSQSMEKIEDSRGQIQGVLDIDLSKL